MYFPANTSYEQIQSWINVQLPVIYQNSKHGIEVNIIQHKNKRSNEQNRFLMCIMTHIVKFYIETGFMPDGCKPWMMRTDVQKAYWKSRYGIESSSKIDPAEFTKFIDYIQTTMVEESQGEWEILTTDSAYLKSLYM